MNPLQFSGTCTIDRKIIDIRRRDPAHAKAYYEEVKRVRDKYQPLIDALPQSVNIKYKAIEYLLSASQDVVLISLEDGDGRLQTDYLNKNSSESFFVSKKKDLKGIEPFFQQVLDRAKQMARIYDAR